MLSERWTLKRGVTVIIALVLVGSVLGMATTGVLAQQGSTQETEPNDAPAGGNPVLNGQINGVLSPADTDWDWYVVKAEKGEVIEATVNFNGLSDDAALQMQIKAPNGSNIAYKEENDGQMGVAAIAPETGTYYIGLQANFFYGAKPSGPISYMLTISPVLDALPVSYTGTPQLSQQPQSESGSNDARLGATQIQGAPISGDLSPSGDEDWFAIQAEEGQRIEALVTVDGIGNDTILTMEIVAPNGSYITGNPGYRTDTRVGVATIAPQSGTYYVHLYTDEQLNSMSYTFTAFAAGGQSADTATETTTQTTTTSTSDGIQTATATPTTTGTPSNASSFPEGYSASGITNPKRAITNHFSSLFAHDSFTLTRNFPFLGPNATFTLVAQISMADKREYTNSTVTTAGRQTLHREHYVTENAYYLAKLSNDTPKYRVADVSFMTSVRETTAAPLSDHDTLSKVLRYVEFGDAKQVTRNGTTLWRYESTELLRASKFVPLSGLKLNESNKFVVNGTVNEFNATILVGADGIVRSTSYSITYTKTGGKQMTVTGMVTVNRIDATTVEKPDWLDEAKANTSGQITATGQTTPTTAPQTATATPTPTPTMIPTETTTSAGNASDGNDSSKTTTGGNDSGESSMFGPGFGPVVAVVALLAIALLAVRQR